ncbi:energy transducer TonB [Flavobacterium arcticum]|uniref:Energy transducer TonB n=1 Tax=Flavobacterium arcticum TaxID=1784713 RepID=A0A345H806_9FLAO|nr:energy transducer TonB [Flavobacterium arcticum]AXG72716.1 energy transducer TonB [Flavobacterium arcticum]KAF2511013.1 energy transducer TonB [Flavobacterium arcticum]
MSKVNVFNQGWIDLVFEGRNKQYGAYQLRQQESRTTIIALITGIALILALVSIPAAINYFNPQEPIVSDNSGPTLIEPKIIDESIYKIPEEPKPEPAKPEPIIEEPAAAAPVTPEPTIRFRPVEAVSTPVVIQTPTTEQVNTTQTSSVTSEGDGSGNFSTGVTSHNGIEGGTGTGTDPNGTGEAVNLAILDEAPSFPGGIEKFYRKVGREFNIPETGNATTLKVYISFVVEKDGTMSNIKVLRDPGYGAGKEAIRVLKSIRTKWKPGKMKGQAVRTAYNLPITLNIK